MNAIHRSGQLGLFTPHALTQTTKAPENPTITDPTLGGRLAVPVFRVQLVRERDHETAQITTPRDVARVCCELLDGYDREVFLVLALSTSNRVIGAHAAHVGTIDASIASPREVFKFGLLVNARSVICAHNHPSGNVEPSRADVAVSVKLRQAGESLDIPLHDSLVIGYGGRFTSLVERGLI